MNHFILDCVIPLKYMSTPSSSLTLMIFSSVENQVLSKIHISFHSQHLNFEPEDCFHFFKSTLEWNLRFLI